MGHSPGSLPIEIPRIAENPSVDTKMVDMIEDLKPQHHLSYQFLTYYHA
jgi:hypothetical protein